MAEDTSTARKDDSGKPDLSLIPYIALVKAAEAFGVGEGKYGRYNYCKPGLTASQILGALMRHAGKWYNGEEVDADDGQHHMGAVIACAAMILRKQELGTLTDDRYGLPEKGYVPKRGDLVMVGPWPGKSAALGLTRTTWERYEDTDQVVDLVSDIQCGNHPTVCFCDSMFLWPVDQLKLIRRA